MVDVELEKIIEELNKTYKAQQEKNDQRIKELEKKGHAPGDLEEKVRELGAQVLDLIEAKEALETKLNRPAIETPEDKLDKEGKELKEIVLKYMRHGENALTPDEIKLLATDSDPDGGYWVTSDVSSRVITKMFETSPMRDVANTETIGSDALEMGDDLGEAGGGLLSERGTPGETPTPKVGVRRIPVHGFYSDPKTTQQMLDDANRDIEGWLIKKVSEKLARLENTYFITGTGNDRPRGILDYPAGTTNPGQIEQINSGSAAALTPDGLRKIIFTLKDAYIANATWLMARSTLEAISLLKEDGKAIWQPNFQAGVPTALLGHPIKRMADMPAVVANSLSIAFGDFREGYTIVDRQGIRILRDPFSNKPLVEFFTTKRTGGDVTNFEAYVIQKTAA